MELTPVKFITDSSSPLSISNMVWTPAAPLIANVTAAPVEDPAEIRDLLVRQITGMVRWRESVLVMKENGVDTLVELGVGRVLTGLARRIDRELSAMTVSDPDGVEAFLKN